MSAPTLIDTKTAGDDRLLAEFCYACDHWLASMTPSARAKAVEYAKKVADTTS